MPSDHVTARELRILNAIAEALNSAPDVPQALARTLALVADLLGLQTGWVWLIDPETQQIYSAAAQNLPDYLQKPVRMTGHSCWCLDSFRAGKLTPKNIDVMECSRLRAAIQDNELNATQGLHSHASIPLYFQDKPLGVMNVTGPSGRRLTRNELQLLSTIAYQVGIAIERARLSEAGTRLARAEERTRIAREIHDTLAQSLTGIALHIESALPHLQKNPERARERLERALDMTRESLEEARRSVLNLRAIPLAGKTLPQALRALVRGFTAETGIRVHLDADEGRSLPSQIETELFRIAQESLANVKQHARATEVRLLLRLRTGGVRLTIRDDGQGFDLKRTPCDGHGIVGMRERAKLLGGTLRLASRPERGTTITVGIPLEREP